MKNNDAQIVSIQASAGSGKTYNLVKRYISLAFAQNNVKNIVAVTFTNKAATEMRYRILETLKKAALGLESDNIFDGLNLRKDILSAKSAELLDLILNSYDNFNVRTIDSFMNRVANACAINMGLSPHFKTDTDDSKTIELSIDLFLNRAEISVLEECVKQFLLSGSSGWLVKDKISREVKNIFIKTGHTGKEISAVDCRFDDEIEILSAKLYEKISNFNKTYLKEFEKLNGTTKFGKDKKIAVTLEELKDAKTLREAFSKPLNYKKNSLPDAQAVAKWDEIRSDLSALCEFYSFHYYGLYSKMFAAIEKDFEALSKNDETLYISQYSKKILGLFYASDGGENRVLPEVYCRLSEKYRHFLIDEFQDTSPIQFSALKQFLEDSVSGEDGSLFYVGDPKQAIYAFRGGDYKLFYEVPAILNRDIKPKPLNENYRSCKNIVEFNNELFSKERLEEFVNAKNDGEFSLIPEVYFGAAQKTVRTQEGFAEVFIIDARKCTSEEDISAAQKSKLLSIVQDALNRGFQNGDIAVLCAKNAELAVVGRWLIDAGFEIESKETLNILNNPFVKEILSLLAFAANPADNISFAGFISGEIFAKAASIGNFLFENRAALYLYKSFEESRPQIWSLYFEEIFKQAGFVPVYELALSVISKFQAVENFPRAKSAFMRLLDFIKEFERDGGGLKDFIDAVKSAKNSDKKLYIQSSLQNAVKLTTIHQAKGLEFPVVIIPFFSVDPGWDLSSKSMSVIQSRGGLDLIFLNETFAKFSQSLAKLYYEKTASDDLSNINRLYVALTRAREELYVIAVDEPTQNDEKKGKSGQTARFLGGARSVGERVLRAKKTAKPAQPENLIQDDTSRGYKDVKEFFSPSEKTIGNINESALEGSITHFALSQIKTIKNKDVSYEIGLALEKTQRAFRAADISFLKDRLEKTLSLARQFFLCQEDDVKTECEISDSLGNVFRIDRLIISKDCAQVIDFKSSLKNLEEHVRQVKHYVSLIEETGISKNARGFIVNSENGEIVNV
ncbi:MAG: UvrD-helicase domain-containing protein [Endomicrobium sp.]|jgi:ATP-dependent exoDNAse (exonuclease V) beta subunit|nr:UvrD-helicase domain-containing protein [Endomicrobium sp.]